MGRERARPDRAAGGRRRRGLSDGANRRADRAAGSRARQNLTQIAALHLIERVGAYVGFAAFLGLAILALLYFSQARDVRRLREWAGRAPERATDLAATQQHHLPPTTIEQAGQKQRKPLRERLQRIHIPQFRYI